MTLSVILNSGTLGLVSLALILSLLGFLIFFFIPSIKLWWDLRRINRILAQVRAAAESAHQVIDPALIGQKAMQSEPFRHLWVEYSETLHAQYATVNGQQKIIAQRSTAPAEMFFSQQVLVDIPLRTDFFKHLPGIFTGIGIIGTFSGLIEGLRSFKTSTAQRETALRELEGLVHKVSDAFLISAIAITLAMVITAVERIIVTLRYKQVEELCQLIDSMFTSGVSEEYLARLVNASEESATQTTQLKDSLVADLKELMTNLVDRQIQATLNSHQVMAATISESITTGLKMPMEALSRVVDQASQNQGESVQRVLSDVISAFMVRLEQTVGGQISGLNALMLETTTSMRETRDRFAELVDNIGNAGTNAGRAMTDQLSRAMEQAEQRQRDMNEQMHRFVEQIRELVSQSQTETSHKLHSALDTLGQKMGHIMDGLAAAQGKIGEEASRRQEALAGQAQTAMSDLNAQVTDLTSQTAQAIQAMQESVTAIGNITAGAIEKMNRGADVLSLAASEFAKAGGSVSGVFERAGQVAEKLATTATGLDAAAKTVQLAVSAYDSTRTELAGTIEALRAIIDSAKRDAGVSRELVAQLEAAAAKFNDVQKQTEAYLENVSGVLTHTFESFSESMKRALDRSRTEFDLSLANAVGMLRSTISDLEDYLAQFPPRR